MVEQTFLSEGDVLVTNARFIVSRQTYVINSLTSIKYFERQPDTKVPDTISGIGVLIAIIAWFTMSSSGSGFFVSSLIFASLFLVIGLIWRSLQKSEFSVVLNTAAGEVQALNSKNKDFISRITNALNEAIIARA